MCPVLWCPPALASHARPPQPCTPRSYANTALPLLLPAVEDGITSGNWRIRQSSVELLGDLLFKVGVLGGH